MDRGEERPRPRPCTTRPVHAGANRSPRQGRWPPDPPPHAPAPGPVHHRASGRSPRRPRWPGTVPATLRAPRSAAAMPPVSTSCRYCRRCFVLFGSFQVLFMTLLRPECQSPALSPTLSMDLPHRGEKRRGKPAGKGREPPSRPAESGDRMAAAGRLRIRSQNSKPRGANQRGPDDEAGAPDPGRGPPWRARHVRHFRLTIRTPVARR